MILWNTKSNVLEAEIVAHTTEQNAKINPKVPLIDIIR